MADDWKSYIDDSRIVCKYGPECYQKNPDHHKTYKHPPTKRKDMKNTGNLNKKRYSPYNKEKNKPVPVSNSDKVEKQIRIAQGDSINFTHLDTTTAKKEQERDAVVNETIIQSEESKINAKIKDVETIKNSEVFKLPEILRFYDKDTDKSILKTLFLVDMPDDFFKFYDFISGLDKSAVEIISKVNLDLIGPFDLFLGKLPVLDDKELYLIHWRFFYDPPEFQAVLKKKNSEYHIGYFRDTPEQQTALLASNDSAKDCHIQILSDNIFGAVYQYLQNEKKCSPFMTMPCQKFMDKIKAYTDKNNISLEAFDMKKRLSQIVTKSFHRAGVVVPYDKKTQVGYRRLVETDAKLKKVFTSLQEAKSQKEKDKIFSDLQVVFTNASIAIDECDFGTGLELGIDLFCSGLKDLHSVALSNLNAAYTVLSRKPFAQIAEAHLKYRRKGPKMSLLSL